MAASQDSAELIMELHDHNADQVDGTANFHVVDISPEETLSLSGTTWKKMGYPHFITAVIKTTKS